MLETSQSPSEFAERWKISDPTNVLASERHALFERIVDLAERELNQRKADLDTARRRFIPAPLAPEPVAPSAPTPTTPALGHPRAEASSPSSQSTSQSESETKTKVIGKDQPVSPPLPPIGDS